MMVSRPTPAFAYSHPAHVIAFGFGAGLARFAPGTWGTAAAWLPGLLYPGLVSLAIMFALFVPPAWSGITVVAARPSPPVLGWLLPLMYAWNGLSMVAAWAMYRLEKMGLPTWLRDALLLVVGYGPFMNAIAFAAMIAQWRKVEQRWDKTIKSGKARIPGQA